jgi:hypothetical protein
MRKKLLILKKNKNLGVTTAAALKKNEKNIILYKHLSYSICFSNFWSSWNAI